MASSPIAPPRCLREAEHRSTAFIPYWQIPGMSGEGSPLEGQRKFAVDLKLLNGKLDDCIAKAFETKVEADIEELEEREYSADDDASLLRFLVDMKGDDVSDHLPLVHGDLVGKLDVPDDERGPFLRHGERKRSCICKRTHTSKPAP